MTLYLPFKKRHCRVSTPCDMNEMKKAKCYINENAKNCEINENQVLFLTTISNIKVQKSKCKTWKAYAIVFLSISSINSTHTLAMKCEFLFSFILFLTLSLSCVRSHAGFHSIFFLSVLHGPINWVNIWRMKALYIPDQNEGMYNTKWWKWFTRMWQSFVK